MHNYAEKIFWIKSYYTSPNRIRKLLSLLFPHTFVPMWLSLSPHVSVPRNRCNIYLIFIIPSLLHSVVFIPHLPFASASLSLSFTVFFKPYKKPQPHTDALSAVITLLSHQWKSQSIRRSVFSFSPSIHPSLKAWSSISSSHYAQTWHKTNSRSFMQPHISPVRRAYACVCVWEKS